MKGVAVSEQTLASCVRGCPSVASDGLRSWSPDSCPCAPSQWGGGGAGQRGPGLKSSHRKLKPCFLEKAHSHAPTHSHIYTQTLPPHTYTNTRTLTQTHTHALTHSHTHTNTHTFTHLHSNTPPPHKHTPQILLLIYFTTLLTLG